MNPSSFSVTCVNGHVVRIGIDDLADIFDTQLCPQCAAEISAIDPREVEVECTECGWEESNDWETAAIWLWRGCPRCESNTNTSGNIQIAGTHSHTVCEYENFSESADTEIYERTDRPDYWELIVHYTSKANFLSIMEEGLIEAKNTGYFGVPAVCLTEVPIKFSSEFKSHFGPYGIVFRKSDILRNSGGPAVYLPETIIKMQLSLGGFCTQIKPFINLVRITGMPKIAQASKKCDFLHEREWRFPKNLVFSNIEPFAVILPEGRASMKFQGSDGRKLINYAWKYKEIR